MYYPLKSTKPERKRYFSKVFGNFGFSESLTEAFSPHKISFSCVPSCKYICRYSRRNITITAHIFALKNVDPISSQCVSILFTLMAVINTTCCYVNFHHHRIFLPSTEHIYWP